MYDDTLKLMYNFDNRSSLGENDTHAVDISNFSYNGTVNSSIVWNSTGKYGGAFTFSTNGSIKVSITRAQEVALGINVEATILTWVNINDPDKIGKHRIFRTTLDRDRYITLNDGVLYGYHYNGPLAGNQPVSWNFSNYSGWTQVGFYYNQNNGSNQVLKLYINGIKVNETTYVTTTAVDNGADYYIGAGTDGSNFINGSIDELRIWNRSLSAAEIYQQYISNLNKFNSTQWYLYVNQSKNATDGLDTGNYTYQTFAQDNAGNLNFTDIRTITISSSGCPATPQNWAVSMSDNLAINSECNLTGYNITFSGTGSFTINSTFYVNEINGFTDGMTIWMKQDGILYSGVT